MAGSFAETRGAAMTDVLSRPSATQDEGELALASFYGIRTAQDFHESLRHAKRAPDSVSGQIARALCMGIGKGCSQNVGRALELLKPLVATGEPMANAAASIIMHEGRPFGFIAPAEIAVEFREELAEMFIYDEAERTKCTRLALERLRPRLKTDAVACFMSGQLLGWGMGIPKDGKEAEKLFLQSFDLGCSDAANQLGNLACGGRPARYHEAEALRWFRKSADAGNVVAKTNLATFDSTLSLADKRSLMTEAAEAGYPAAMLWLGGESIFGCLIPHDLQAGRRWLEKAALIGDGDSLAQLGRILRDQATTDEERVRGTRMLRQAVAKGSDLAANYLCVPFLTGAPGIPANPKVGYTLSVIASNRGMADAWAVRSFALEKGFGVTKDLKAARKCLEEGAAEGSAWATYSLGSFIERGLDGPPDLKLAFQYFLAAAEKGESQMAMRIVGNRLMEGKGVAKDDEAGVAWLRKAIAHHDIMALGLLGAAYEKGTGVPTDPREAVRCYREAAEGGDGRSMYELARMMTNGIGITPDPEAAFNLLMASEKLGIKESCYMISRAYESGVGVAINPSEAWRWLLKAAESNDANACNWLADGYRTGRTGQPSPEKAFEWYTKAAALHHPKGTNNLGCCYQFGNGVQADPARAFALYTQSVELGEPMACINLAICHERGIGTPVDLEKAKEWRRVGAHR